MLLNKLGGVLELKKLIRLANHLDSNGLYKEADDIDDVIKKLAGTLADFAEVSGSTLGIPSGVLGMSAGIGAAELARPFAGPLSPFLGTTLPSVGLFAGTAGGVEVGSRQARGLGVAIENLMGASDCDKVTFQHDGKSYYTYKNFLYLNDSYSFLTNGPVADTKFMDFKDLSSKSDDEIKNAIKILLSGSRANTKCSNTYAKYIAVLDTVLKERGGRSAADTVPSGSKSTSNTPSGGTAIRRDDSSYIFLPKDTTYAYKRNSDGTFTPYYISSGQEAKNNGNSIVITRDQMMTAGAKEQQLGGVSESVAKPAEQQTTPAAPAAPEEIKPPAAPAAPEEIKPPAAAEEKVTPPGSYTVLERKDYENNRSVGIIDLDPQDTMKYQDLKKRFKLGLSTSGPNGPFGIARKGSLTEPEKSYLVEVRKRITSQTRMNRRGGQRRGLFRRRRRQV